MAHSSDRLPTLEPPIDETIESSPAQHGAGWIDPIDAARSARSGFGKVLFDLGKGWIVIADLAALAVGFVGSYAIGTVAPLVAALVLILVLAAYTQSHLQGWVASHNAKVDELEH